MILSQIKVLNQNIPFPKYLGSQHYMVKIFSDEKMAYVLKRWRNTIEAMMAGIENYHMAYVTIDQREIMPGKTHRRPGIHVDGAWFESKGGITSSGHQVNSGHSIYDEPIVPEQGLILASNVYASDALLGEYLGAPDKDGYCKHVDMDAMARLPLAENIAWAGNSRTLLHESVPVKVPTKRTLVRINVVGWTPF